MIIAALEGLSKVLCEASATGKCDGVEIVLPRDAWRALATEVDRKSAESRMAPPLRPFGPVCVIIHSAGGAITVREGA